MSASAAAEPPVHFYAAKDEYGELSNFAVLKQPLLYRGKLWKTSEHLYQALKFMPDDASDTQLAYAELIRTASTPNKARVLALRKVGGGYPWRLALNEPIRKAIADGVEKRADWHEVKLDMMRKVLELKFGCDAHCRRVLLSTGTRPLFEHTHRDKFWGDGLDGSGENNLGQLLEERRTLLADQSPEKRRRTGEA